MCLLHTGRSLEAFSSREVYAIGAYLYVELHKMTEDEAKVRDKLIGEMRKVDREVETGMPAVTEMYRPANEMYQPS